MDGVTVRANGFHRVATSVRIKLFHDAGAGTRFLGLIDEGRPGPKPSKLVVQTTEDRPSVVQRKRVQPRPTVIKFALSRVDRVAMGASLFDSIWQTLGNAPKWTICAFKLSSYRVFKS